MLLYKICLVLGEGLVFSLLAIGVYISFNWQRFPDLTPDGSFVLGACLYAKSVLSGIPIPLALLASVCVGAIAGCFTASINRFAKIPTVVSGLIASTALYSVSWILLGKPNQFIDPQFTLVGDVSGIVAALRLLGWLFFILVIIVVALHLLGQSTIGLRLRAIGENPLLANDVGCSQTAYTILALALSNGIVGLAGALFAQRSFSADINMGIGITITGLSGMILGLLIVGSHRKIWLIIGCLIIGSVLNKIIIFVVLDMGLPGETFRLITAMMLIFLFIFFNSSPAAFLKNLKWN